MIRAIFAVILVAALVACGQGASSAASTNNPTISAESLKKSLKTTKPYTDLANAFHSVQGLKLLGEASHLTSDELCTMARSKVDKNSLESIYHALTLASIASGCKMHAAEFRQTIEAGHTSKNIADIYYSVMISTVAKEAKFDSKKVAKALTDALKSDSSIMNQAYALHIASELATHDQKPFYDMIEDILEQADEVDKKYLQYEGGVGTTSFVLDGIFELAADHKKMPAKFTQERMAKFANYLTAKRFPGSFKAAHYLTRITHKLCDNQFFVPIVINRLSPIAVSTSKPNVLVSLTNIMGNKLAQKFSLEAESAKSAKKTGGTLFATKKAFSSKSNDGTTFELKLLNPADKSAADFYTVTMNVTPKPAQYFLMQKTVDVKLTTQVSIVEVEIGAADRDQSSPKLTSLTENSQLPNKLEADAQSKFFLRFGIKDKLTDKPIEAHQVFVRFTEVKTGREIVFLGQASSNNHYNANYNADVDFSTNVKNFRGASGMFSVDLIITDPLIENPVSWKLADIKLKLGEESLNAVAEKAKLYATKPEIKHTFRLPDSMPPKLVSTVFAALCLAPLVLLLILWFGIGFNFKKFSFSPFGIIFHLSLAAIFGLFFLYWTHLNMFQTSKYLAVLGLVVFISGNKMLKGLAKR